MNFNFLKHVKFNVFFNIFDFFVFYKCFIALRVAFRYIFQKYMFKRDSQRGPFYCITYSSIHSNTSTPKLFPVRDVLLRMFD